MKVAEKETQSLITNLKTQLSDMESHLGHVENGSLTFDGISSWSSNTYVKWRHDMKYKDMTVIFEKPYPSPPLVTWSVEFLHSGSQANLVYSVDVIAVSSTNFTIRAGVYAHSTAYQFSALILQWFSSPR